MRSNSSAARYADEQCFLCKDQTEGSVEWCYGCKHYICDHHPNDVFGGHKASEHNSHE